MSVISIVFSRSLGPRCSSAAIRARSAAVPSAREKRPAPTSPDISLPWSGECGRDGWSAKMFAHQMLATSSAHWSCSDTQALLSRLTVRRSRGNPGPVSSLLEALSCAEKPCKSCFMSAYRVGSILKRHAIAGRSFRVFSRLGAGVVSATIAFSTRGDSASVQVRNANGWPDFLKDGLMDFLRKHAGDSAATPASPPKASGSADGL